MKFVSIILFILLIFTLQGCSNFREVFLGNKNASSYTSENFPVSQAYVIANDISERLVAGYPPGQTSIFLYISGEGEVAQAIEDVLRNNGFHILPEPDPDSLTLSWRLDRLDESTWYLSVDLSSGFRFNRIYSYNGSNLSPVGLLSQGIF
jgi:hypothetical protein